MVGKRYKKDRETGMSRQRRWQLARKAEGRCQICGKPVDPEIKAYCPFHRVMANILQRKYALNRKNRKKKESE